MTCKPSLITTIVILFFATAACVQNRPTEDFNQAELIYNQSVELEMEVRSIFRSLEQVLARDSTLAEYDSELKALSEEMGEWEQEIFRVGEGETAEPLGHQHPVKELPDAEMHARQKKLNVQLSSLSDRLIALMEKMSR